MKKCPGCNKDTIENETTYIYNGIEICRDCYWLIRYGVWPD